MQTVLYKKAKQKEHKQYRQSTLIRIKKGWQLYVLLALPMFFLLLFAYYPMLGAQIAFKNFIVTKGIWGSPWVGLKHFKQFINSYVFLRILSNTLYLSLYSLIAGFPLPIILALCLNYVGNQKFKKTVQLISYAPHFISTVVMVGMILQFFAPRTGLITKLLALFGGDLSASYLSKPSLFPSIYVWTGIWQNVGYSSIIYIATLSSIDPELHNAAIVDGASKLQRMRHIDLPGILPTAVILLIMNTGHLLSVGFEKVLLMQNPLNLRTAEVIDTYVYKIGLTAQLPNFSYSTAIGLFKSVVGLLMIIGVNKIAKKLGETSLW